MAEVFPQCARCNSQVFELKYDTDEEVLYCDCAECGLKVVKFMARPFHSIDKNTDH